MEEEHGQRQQRATTHFKFFSEKYLWGSTKRDLKPDERAVWIDFLCVASINLGVVEIYSRNQFAQQLVIPRELLDRSIEKFVKSKKIKRKYKKNEKKEIFTITKWSHYQADYLTKRLKKSTTYEKEERVVKTGYHESNFLPILEERRGDNITLQEEKNIINIESDEDYIEDKEIPLENPPSSNQKPFTDGKTDILQEYLARLGSCPGYPLDDYKDTALFRHIEGEYPGIDILRELDKKISWWDKHPDALDSTTSPRQKLAEWFLKEYEFQSMRGQE